MYFVVNPLAYVASPAADGGGTPSLPGVARGRVAVPSATAGVADGVADGGGTPSLPANPFSARIYGKNSLEGV